MDVTGVAEKSAISEAEAEAVPSRRYQVNVQQIDVPTTLDKVVSNLHRNKWLATIHAQRNLRRMNINAHFSLRDIDLKRFNQDIFEPMIGSIIVTGDLPDTPLGRFYTPERIYKQDEKTELRGSNYYVDLDPQKKDPQSKIAVMERDLTEDLRLLSEINRGDIKTEREFLLYLGLLDYLKIHSLSIFHAVTYGERRGELPSEDEYLTYRKKAHDLMVGLTRSFYQACLGQPFDIYFSPGNMISLSAELIAYLKKSVDQDEYYRFTYPEINNPLIIMLGAQEAALKNPQVDTIIGIPSGGTETAIAVQLAYQYLGRKIPNLSFVPLSAHSLYHSKTSSDRLAEMIDQLYPDSVTDKAILMVDDNANTGTTIQTMSQALGKLKAASDRVHLAQHDPERMTDKYQRSGSRKYNYLFKADHPTYQTTMGLVVLNKQKKDLAREMILKRLEKKRT